MQAHSEIKNINNDSLLLMGAMLYWAEGAKQKEHDVSQGVCFSNSDPYMLQLFLLWLKRCLRIEENAIAFDIYIHETYCIDKKINSVVQYWSRMTGFPVEKFDKIYYKKHKLSSNRKKKEYFGLLRVKVKRSTDLNRKITGLIEGICQQCGIV